MFLSDDAVRALGLARVGTGVQIDSTVVVIGAPNIEVGSSVRIDAFSVLSAPSARLRLGDHVHLSVGVSLFGASGIELEDFVGLSARVTVYSQSDDFTEGFLTGPTVPARFRKLTTGPVTLRRHALVGAGAVILPGVDVGVGAAVGALSLVTRSVPPFTRVAGCPARPIGTRDRDRLQRLEAELRASGDDAV